ncbi:hypothetical protein 16Q_126 [Pseudomonas phage 16Q]|nr:hypothetical protein 16Q_126 [Pseudomonas phage 16Q]
MSNFDICKDKWFYQPNSVQGRDAFLEWAYEQGMVWMGLNQRSNEHLIELCCIGGNSYREGQLGWVHGSVAEGVDFYESRGHIKISPVFKYKLIVDIIPPPVVESPQQKQVRELEETIAKAQEQIESLKKVI